MQAETSQVCISDLDPDTVELLLRYCYGCLQELPADHCQVATRAHATDASTASYRAEHLSVWSICCLWALKVCFRSDLEAKACQARGKTWLPKTGSRLHPCCA